MSKCDTCFNMGNDYIYLRYSQVKTLDHMETLFFNVHDPAWTFSQCALSIRQSLDGLEFIVEYCTPSSVDMATITDTDLQEKLLWTAEDARNHLTINTLNWDQPQE